MMYIWEEVCIECDLYQISFTESASNKFYKDHATKGHLHSISMGSFGKIIYSEEKPGLLI